MVNMQWNIVGGVWEPVTYGQGQLGLRPLEGSLGGRAPRPYPVVRDV